MTPAYEQPNPPYVIFSWKSWWLIWRDFPLYPLEQIQAERFIAGIPTKESQQEDMALKTMAAGGRRGGRRGKKSPDVL